MRKLTAREVGLLLFVAVLGVIGWVYSRGGNLGAGGAGDTALDPLDYGAPPVVELARLGLPPEDFDPKSRNLFAYYTPAPPPRPQPKPVERVAPPPRTAVAPVERTEMRPPPPPPKPQPPRPGFRYIGFMGPKDDKIAVLEKGDEVLLARVGEVVDKQYKVLEFKYETLVIGYTAERWAEETTELPMKR